MADTREDAPEEGPDDDNRMQQSLKRQKIKIDEEKAYVMKDEDLSEATDDMIKAKMIKDISYLKKKRLYELFVTPEEDIGETSRIFVEASNVMDSIQKSIVNLGENKFPTKVQMNVGTIKASDYGDAGNQASQPGAKVASTESFKATIFTVGLYRKSVDDENLGGESESSIEIEEDTLKHFATIKSPSGELLTAAFEGYLRNKMKEKAKALKDMTEEEREHELETIKHRRFCDFLSMVLSMIYAINVFLIGCGAYFTDVFIVHEGLWSSYYNCWVAVVGLMWLFFLIFDVGRYVKDLENFWRDSKEHIAEEVVLMQDKRDERIVMQLPESKEDEVVPNSYMFSTERHSGSYFLKVGAAIFCMGQIIQQFLEAGKVISFIAEDIEDKGCQQPLRIVERLLLNLYSLTMLYTIFNFSNIIVNSKKGMARFGFMHLIASNITFWVYDIVKDAFDSVIELALSDPNHCNREIFSLRSGIGLRAGGKGGGGAYKDQVDEEILQFSPLTDAECSQRNFKSSFDYKCYISQGVNCTIANDVSRRVSGVSAILNPFSIQFNILIVGIWYIMWHNVANVDHIAESEYRFVPDKTYMRMVKMSTTPDKPLFSHDDIKTSYSGIFIGVILLVIALTGIALYAFLQNSDTCSHQRIGSYLGESFMICMLFSMTIVGFYCYGELAEFDVNPNPVEFLDDLLLFICIPSFILLAISESTPVLFKMKEKGSVDDELAQVISNVFMILQITVQTPLIVDGLRRCTYDKRKMQEKPGRNLIMFLLMSNLVIYLWENTEIKTSSRGSQSDFYQPLVWVLIKHTTVPLTLFYRFHAAVAFADIWVGAYTTPEPDKGNFSSSIEQFEIVRKLLKKKEKQSQLSIAEDDGGHGGH